MSETLFSAARPNVFLTSFFRSGSTHVKESMLRLLPGYRSVNASYSAGALGNDGYQRVDIFPAQILFPLGSQIFHQHTPGTSGNVAMLKRYQLRPIVQMRNMLDSIVSVRELLATGQPQHLGIYYPESFHLMGEEEQLWWCTRNLPQWYFTFYLSWTRADIPTHIVWYDEYYKDQVVGMRGILDHSGLSEVGSVSDEAIKMCCEVFDPGLSRFKFGRPGRGREILSGAMIDNIIDQAKAWPEGNELEDKLLWRGYED